jgi:hypothetical protein
MSLVNGCQVCLAESPQESLLLICRTLAVVGFTNLSKRSSAVPHRLDACKVPQLLLRVDTPAGKRRVFAVSGGEFVGDRIRGTIFPIIGSDLLLVRGDGSAQQDVRMLLKTDDGLLLLMAYRGIRHASHEVNARIARGEPVDAAEYYLRTARLFETASPNYSWINKIVAVGVGERRSDTVVYEVF